MTDVSRIREHMEVIGADGVHVGTAARAPTRGTIIPFRWPWWQTSRATGCACPPMRTWPSPSSRRRIAPPEFGHSHPQAAWPERATLVQEPQYADEPPG